MNLRALLPVSLAVTVLLAACSRQESAPEPIRAVRTLTVSAGDAGGAHEYAAEVRARTESRLGFRVAGKLTSRPAEVGQRVKAGQVLARLSQASLSLQKAQLNASLASAKASIAQAEASLAEAKSSAAETQRVADRTAGPV